MTRTFPLLPRCSTALVAALLATLLTTAALPAPAYAADATRPYLSWIRVSPTDTRVTLQWWTDEPATTEVRSWTTDRDRAGVWVARPLRTLRHDVVVQDLWPSTTYHVQLRSTDAAGNTGVSADKTFTTAPPSGFDPGTPWIGSPPYNDISPEWVSPADHVVGTGTAASCTSAALASAVSAGGIVTFSCGPTPVTITVSQTLKVRNDVGRLVLDGDGLVTLSGGGLRRILYVDTCDTSLGAVAGRCAYTPNYPEVSVQNITFADGDASGEPPAPGEPELGGNGGGAILQLGGRLKVWRSVFVRNRCGTTGADVGGGAIRVLAQHARTPDSLDSSGAARDQDPVKILRSTFGGASGQGNACSNGGAISASRTPVLLANTLTTDNSAVGCCADPPHPVTPGGGNGGAIESDGISSNLVMFAGRFERNSAKAGGSAIAYSSDDRTAVLRVQSTTSRDNVYAPSGYSPADQHVETYPGIYYVGSNPPDFTGSTIR
jgi:hypothetical protein